MAATVLMPALSPTMEKGKLAKWLKKEGDTVKSGDILAEIETDKATMEIEAVDEGTLGKIMIAAGTEDVLVNTLLATILAEGEKAGDVPVAANLRPPAAAPPQAAENPQSPPPEVDAPQARSGCAEVGNARLRLAPRQAPRQGKGHQPRSRQRLRPPWPHRVEGCGERQARSAAPAAAPSAALSQHHHPTLPSSRTSPKAPMTSCRMTACARSSPAA